jgi:hypothetical protein
MTILPMTKQCQQSKVDNDGNDSDGGDNDVDGDSNGNGKGDGNDFATATKGDNVDDNNGGIQGQRLDNGDR